MRLATKLSLIMAGILTATAAYAVTPPVVLQGSQYGLPTTTQVSDPLRDLSPVPDKSIKHIETGSTDGRAGINIVDSNHVTGYANNKLVSFERMKEMAGNIFVPKDFVSADSNNIYVARLYQMTGFPWSWIPFMPDHSQLGRLTFAQVGTLAGQTGAQDVWFGDWADVPSGAASGTAGTNYTVFYSGSNPTTNLPTSGVATYAVKGVNSYINRDTPLLSGQLTANFGTSKLDGTIARSDLSIAISAGINNAQGYFKGDAVANGTVAGNTGGYFYGDQGAALAGIATFGDHNPLNTSFGGTKQP